MKVIVTSDIHHNKKELENIKNNYKYDLFLDAGDSCLSPHDLCDVLTVKGNCDLHHYPSFRIIALNEKYKVYITHGHHDNLNTLKYKALENNCNIVITGHTHIPMNIEEEGILFLNPGSITRPRGSSKPSFLILDVNDTINVQKIEKLVL